MKKIALSLIFKDELPEIKAIVDRNKEIFDKIYLTNATKGKEVYKIAQDLFKNEPKVELNHFEWVDDFAKARNFNLKGIKEDFWVWQDTDDRVDFSIIRQLVDKMEKEDLDALYCPYNYAQDDLGNTIALHWRERIIRRSCPFEWKGALHETLISEDPPKLGKNDEIVWVHDNPPEKMQASMDRNIKILEREYEKGDPRIAHYLGIAYFTSEKYVDAIRVLREHIQKSGWDEESYRSQIKIAEAYNMLGKPDEAINQALVATKLMTEYPDAYLLLAQLYYELREYEKSLEWLKVANQKPIPETFSIVDPTMYGFRATMLGAMANMQLGRFEIGHQLLKEVLKEQPDYSPAKNMYKLAVQELETKRATESIKSLALYLKDDEKALEALYGALPVSLQYDARVAPLRNMIKKPKKWGKKDIAIFCGNTFEMWGPDTMEQGMGGSEEAIVYLSREFRDMGYSVTVYNTRDVIYEDDGITYLPWYHVDYRDQFNILVCWRAPELAKNLKAKLKVLDVHDVLTPERMNENHKYYDKIFVKTNYHRTLYPDVPDEKFVVIGNGILKEQFKPVEKEPFTALYSSAPDRGILTLLRLWPEIKKRVPKASLKWYYGFQSYVAAMGEDRLYQELKRLLKELEPQDVVEGGRISHQELADEMCKTKAWLYPTEFPEIYCITAVKVEEAGMVPVTTSVAALKETSTQGEKVDVSDIYSNKEAQEEFVEKAVKALTEDYDIKPQEGVTWREVAGQWHTQFQA